MIPCSLFTLHEFHFCHSYEITLDLKNKWPHINFALDLGCSIEFQQYTFVVNIQAGTAYKGVVS